GTTSHISDSSSEAFFARIPSRKSCGGSEGHPADHAFTDPLARRQEPLAPMTVNGRFSCRVCSLLCVDFEQMLLPTTELLPRKEIYVIPAITRFTVNEDRLIDLFANPSLFA